MPKVSTECKLPNGQTIKVFYIGVLAKALGRTPAAIKKWEIGGIIPETCFRDKEGRRLYSQEQIDAILRCAERAHIKQGLSIANTSFSVWVHREMDALKQKYMSKEVVSDGKIAVSKH
jgi:hypothetical protein